MPALWRCAAGVDPRSGRRDLRRRQGTPAAVLANAQVRRAYLGEDDEPAVSQAQSRDAEALS